ncbi:DUF4382 domain-containing protein [Marivirga arenosa]|uniref:DUF4382 domain-containing protein n=1 Tax=Marivirga arenosa TaxID=3059076 RepID=A0AA49JAC1_9BACT|nr:DUF4382 domain-containing protein [Marivirga sp. ABR2-2]WKK85944.2 DUF4382 domain-containing protein [Marivirga sp. ABR2-2]
MRPILSLILILPILAFYSCNKIESGHGRASFYLTDGPLESNNVSGVVICITRVEAFGPDGWKVIKEYEKPEAVDLFSLQGGETLFLEEKELVSGKYDQIKLGLVVSQTSDGGNLPAHYIKFNDGTVSEISVPIGDQAGYTIIGDFTIPDGGITSIIMDFDLRKSVLKMQNSEQIILKPTVRLLEEAKVGSVQGVISGISGTRVAYAYKGGNFNDNESTPNADGVRFNNAESSSNVDENGNYYISYLPSDEYDIVVASFDGEGNFIEVKTIEEGVVINDGELKTLNITI